MKIAAHTVFLLCCCFCVSALAKPLDYFPLDHIRLLDGPFKHAQDTDINYLLAMDMDRLLAPYLREAGLKPKAPSYGNWEGSGLDGHIGGHYVSALALAYAATGREDMRQRLNYMLNELQRAQVANGDGYLGGVPGGRALWQEIHKGKIQANSFSLNHKWVPWYNLHKIFSGLRDAHRYAHDERAKTMFLKLCDWAYELTRTLDDDVIQDMLRTEHGGMNEVFADAYSLSGDKKYLALAKRFSDQSILEPLVQQRDALNGLHANTQIPKVVGFARISELNNSTNWKNAAEFFWSTVAKERSVSIGGNSVREHFHPKNDFSSMISDVEGPETCNTYNMLKLSKLLYAQTKNSDYVDFYERALYNHILPSQHPVTGGLVYFTPMRPQHYRVYSQVDQAMWCCVGSGIENHVKYGEFIYAHDNDALYVNLWLPSQLKWPEKNMEVRQLTEFPTHDRTRLVIDKPAKVALHIRHPAWVKAGQLKAKINGKKVRVAATKPGEYLVITRQWHAGDTVDVELPTEVTAEALPDGKDYYSIFYGPVVLAAQTNPFPEEKISYFADDSRMGHVADGKQCPLPEAPRFVSKTADFYKKIRRIDNQSLTFKTPKSLQHNGKKSLVLKPFYQIHESRYTLYFPYSTPEDWIKEKKLLSENEEKRLALVEATIDHVSPGEQQPESDHFFKGEDTESGVYRGRHWRHAKGWFSYQLKDPHQQAKFLRITYNGLDKNRRFTIEINGIQLAEVTSTGEQGDVLFDVDYPLSEKFYNGESGELAISFKAAPGSVAGGFFDVRLLSHIPDND